MQRTSWAERCQKSFKRGRGIPVEGVESERPPTRAVEIEGLLPVVRRILTLGRIRRRIVVLVAPLFVTTTTIELVHRLSADITPQRSGCVCENLIFDFGGCARGRYRGGGLKRGDRIAIVVVNVSKSL